MIVHALLFQIPGDDETIQILQIISRDRIVTEQIAYVLFLALFADRTCSF